MAVTARELNRSTLARQLLLGREALGVTDGVRRVVALQAQQAASPYLALWNRLADFDPAALDAAFTGREIVKSTLMRITLHAVHADDFPAFREAVQPGVRAARLGSRFTASGLSAEDADELVPRLLAFADRPRTAAECERWLEQRLGEPPQPGAWWGLRQYAPLLHAPTAHPWSFGERPSYVASRYGTTRAVPADPEASAQSLRALVVRYLEGFGPASVADVAQFALVQRGRVRQALREAELSHGLRRLEGPGGEELFDVPGAPLPDGDTPAPPRLMAMWDSILLAYSDRGRVIPPQYRSLVTRVNGDTLATLLVDGYVAGVWRPAPGGVEVTAFHPLPEEVWEALAAEARSLTAFLADRDPEVYRRYGHWWSKLPSAGTRLLV
ncbi:MULTISPECIES: winged helix DNA-binding domain-containing protein [unclassified Streptomyces]|uniref:winged helix DNA-binding domain-containing protein n=1 Tax=unclassified Streptomyces TaxID=2593676 RepID=UPI000DC7B3CE|nr:MULTISPECIES: winged helix DNA-binding domain-containing protein [unclassified Streptomyces]AWZ09059.1 winged helix DNA-binding domain-containing protein [Streptomyces sp. ICC4]AWZ16809.1 winged helix DNA-binding domain-containing protein [Streptomyces sp. ICC1]